MSKFKMYTFYRADGNMQLLYGQTPDDALSAAGFTTEWITENIRDYREGYDYSLEFINGKWHPRKEKPIAQVDIPILEVFKN